MRIVAALAAVFLVGGCAPLLEIVAVNSDGEPYLIQDTQRADSAWLLPPGETRRLTTDRLSLVIVSSDCEIRETISVYKYTRLNIVITTAGEISVATGTGAPGNESVPAATSAEPCREPRVP